MDLQHVDIGSQPLDAPLHRIEDVLPAQPDLIDHRPVVRAHRRDVDFAVLLGDAEETLAQDDELLARDVVLLDGLADELFAAAVGVDVGRVPGVDADVVGVFEEGERLGFVEDPGLPVGGAVAHCS